jgi:hypothetical protein
MAQTKVSAAASISSCTRSRRLQREPRFAQDPDSGTDMEMEEAVSALMGGPSLEGSEAPVASIGVPGLKALVIEGSSATNIDEIDFLYDRTHFRKYKSLPSIQG